MDARALIDRLAAGGEVGDGDLRRLVESRSPADLVYLARAAGRVRHLRVGDAVHLRGLLEFSNHCRGDCLYCGLRRENTGVSRYRLAPAEIETAVTAAAASGFGTVVFQSGEDPWYDADKVARLVRQAKGLGLAVALSLGERRRDELALWRREGADRYLLRHETAQPELHAQLRPGRTLARRVAVLETLKELGYQVGTGFMVGLPGQTAAGLVADLRLAASMEADMVGIGPFIPHPGTPLGGAGGGDVAETIKLVALARLLLPEAMIPATTAVGSLDPRGRARALAAGANVIMRNVTPAAVRRHYQLYPGKTGHGGTAGESRDHLERCIRGLGLTVGAGPGHSPRWERRNRDECQRNGFHR